MAEAMLVRALALALAALLLAGAPSAFAQPAAETPSAASAGPAQRCLDGVRAPPCGYIVPQIGLDFPDKPTCRAKTLGGPIDLSQCLPLPEVGGSRTLDGVFRFSWDITQDGTYPPDAACMAPETPCITVTFSGTSTNPSWVDLQVEPAEVVLDAAAFADPANMRVDPETQQVVFLLEVPLQVTFKREASGHDDERAVGRIERSQGAVQVFLKAKSSGSGQYYKEAFGVEEFRFDPCANGDALSGAVGACSAAAAPANDAPAGSLLGAVAALGLAAIAGRRRR